MEDWSAQYIYLNVVGCMFKTEWKWMIAGMSIYS